MVEVQDEPALGVELSGAEEVASRRSGAESQAVVAVVGPSAPGV